MCPLIINHRELKQYILILFFLVALFVTVITAVCNS